MKRSKSDIVLLVFKIIILALITAYLAYSVLAMATTDTEAALAGLVFVIVLAIGIYVNGGAFLLSLAFLIMALCFKKVFLKKADKEAEGYEKCLKIKKRNVLHFGLLMAYAAISEIVIYIVGSIIF